MKKIVFSLILLVGCINVCLGGQKKKLVVDFWGVDFASVVVQDYDTPSSKFIDAFGGINTLFVSEAKKYDVKDAFGVAVNSYKVRNAINNLKALDEVDFMNTDPDEIVVEDVLQRYPTEEGLKLIIIAEELDKLAATARYQAVIFDGQTKEVVKTYPLEGKPRGFGLRNFWAGSLYDALSNMKYLRD